MTITEFLNARLDEDEAVARASVIDASRWSVFAVDKYFGQVDSDDGAVASSVDLKDAEHIARHDPARVLAEVEAKRKIIAFHEQWPVLVQTEPKIEFSGGDTLVGTIDTYTARMSQQIDWQTTQQYRARFGTEPPTAPMLRALVQVYVGHPDFEEEWRL